MFQISQAGVASKRTGAEEPLEFEKRTPLLAGIAFIVTIVVLCLVYTFVP